MSSPYRWRRADYTRTCKNKHGYYHDKHSFFHFHLLFDHCPAIFPTIPISIYFLCNKTANFDI